MKQFLLGMVFGELIFPLLGDVGSLVASALETVTTSFQKASMKQGLEIAKLKKEIESIMHAHEPEESARVVGFNIPISDDEEEEEELE